ncbi:dicer-like protein 4 isoform X1 [Syzygium oleosum]|uniref:dicer-like protein 4 isoform X1 n=1 Tax=Syzygium oleosum TaxID=219896 RepID=UPI0024BB662E|nr:dicer-like protein 4 isoform X1 [Syzygium oleosum]
MPDGEAEEIMRSPNGLLASSCSPLPPVSGLSAAAGDDEGVSWEAGRRAEKDPRRIARKYQLELCKKAVEENVIVYLGTGSGKTHIAILLMHEMGHLIRKPNKNICVFLAPTVALVQQQARVIEDSIDLKVGSYCGGSKRLKTHAEWENEIEKYEVLVMTPIILLRSLSHCFIKMDSIALLIFDECHHAQVKSGHPYAEIMRIFYKADLLKRPRIFGMTASPVVGKGASEQENLPRSINSLENLLNAKVYSVEDKEELDSFVASPTVKVYCYGPVVRGASSSFSTCFSQLEEVKRQCLSTLSRKKDDHQILQSTKRMLNRMHENIIICAEKLGLWGATQACQILLRGDYSERNALIEAAENSSDVPLCDRYLTQASSIFASDCPKGDISALTILKEPLFSCKLLCLVRILSSFRSQPNAKCIVFVNRIVIARSLTYILQNLTMLASWKCDYLVGVHSGQRNMSRKNMKGILDNFQSGKLNLLVATKVGEEGLDIQTCCLVIRFDPPETVSSFIQSRGRARMPQSEYAFLVDRGNQKEIDLIDNFKKDEDRMNVEITARTSDETFSALEERIYRVDSSGASISSGSSISLLYQYCAKLPHDEYFDPKPKFYYFDDVGGTVCHIILPANSPIHQIVSAPRLSMEAAKKEASLQAIEELHKLGALDDFLLPQRDDDKLEEMVISFDSLSCEDEGSRGELHEMLVPDALRETWSGLKNVALHTYYIEFCPDPADRTYKEFGLFVKARLPAEAEIMEIDLHLARGRSVKTKLVPSAVVAFDKDEIVEAQKFQEMFLKVILDRSDLQREFIPLGQDNDFNSGSSYYLLLPVILQKSNSCVSVDWKTIRRCLSSPLFENPTHRTVFGNPTHRTAKTYALSRRRLTLANGSEWKSDVENSLVYAPYKKLFYFITSINSKKSGGSRYKDSDPLTHAEHINRTYGLDIELPEQPLLHAKPLFLVRNLLHNRKQDDSEAHELEEYLIDIPPELCELKILGFSKDLGSSLSLLPSIMHRLQNLLVAIQLKHRLSASFSEGAKVTANRILEALTTEKCQERFSLERLEILGDAFLKFAVGRHLFLRHEALDEGGLTRKRSKAVNNSNLFSLAVKSNLQVYIRDQPFEASQFFALGRPCPNICNKESEGMIHSHHQNGAAHQSKACEVRCSKGHHWLQKKTIADVIEALVGAFIVDSGFKAATAFLRWIGLEVDFDASQVISACIASTRYLTLADCVDIDSLENYLGYKFHHRGLLLQAFIHPSYNKHGGGCYQRLEFLGDAVLDYLITSYLYSAYPKLKPGELTDLRSLAVNNKAFANVAVDRSFHKFLLCDSSSLTEVIKDYVDFVKRSASLKGSLEGPKCPKALGDLVESCVGAILLDTGFDLNSVWKIMLSFLDPIMSFSNFQLNPKRELQELCQSRNLILKFSVSKKGVSYSVETKVSCEDECATASVTNLNKQDALRNSAQQVIEQLKAQGYTPKSKSLEEILKSSCKMEARLIGYDEAPVDVMSFDVDGSENINVAPSNMNCSRKVYAVNEASRSSSSSIIPLGKQPLSLSETATGSDANEMSADTRCDNESRRKGAIPKGSAKSHLYEICVANCWKPPEFECCKEEGPGHLKLFWYKVVVAIEDSPGMVLESFSDPRETKKAAAEHAAEGALWYLRHEGYVHKNKMKET